MGAPSMPLRCPGCQAPVTLPPHLLGATLRCRQCGAVFAASGAEEPPVVPAVDDPPPDHRIQARAVPKVGKAPAPRHESAMRSVPEPVRKSYGLYIAIGVLLLVLVTGGLVAAGGIVWWLMARSAPQAA